jgi:hypothetical protein
MAEELQASELFFCVVVYCFSDWQSRPRKSRCREMGAWLSISSDLRTSSAVGLI